MWRDVGLSLPIDAAPAHREPHLARSTREAADRSIGATGAGSAREMRGGGERLEMRQINDQISPNLGPTNPAPEVRRIALAARPPSGAPPRRSRLHQPRCTTRCTCRRRRRRRRCTGGAQGPQPRRTRLPARCRLRAHPAGTLPAQRGRARLRRRQLAAAGASRWRRPALANRPPVRCRRSRPLTVSLAAGGGGRGGTTRGGWGGQGGRRRGAHGVGNVRCPAQAPQTHASHPRLVRERPRLLRVLQLAHPWWVGGRRGCVLGGASWA
jgi:hypothetical protein